MRKGGRAGRFTRESAGWVPSLRGAMPRIARIERPRGEGMQGEWGTENLRISLGITSFCDHWQPHSAFIPSPRADLLALPFFWEHGARGPSRHALLSAGLTGGVVLRRAATTRRPARAPPTKRLFRNRERRGRVLVIPSASEGIWEGRGAPQERLQLTQRATLPPRSLADARDDKRVSRFLHSLSE